MPLVVDDRAAHQVVRGEVAGGGVIVVLRVQRRQIRVEDAADLRRRRLPQQLLQVHAAQVPARRRRRRRAHHEHHRRQRRRQLRVPRTGQRLRHRRRRLQDQRVRGHQATHGIRLEDHQPAHRLAFLGLHQLQQDVRPLVVKLMEKVGGVVRVHLLEDVRRTFDGEVVQDLGLVVVGKLLDDVRQQLVVQGLRDAAATLRRHLAHRHRDVGGAHLVELRDELRVMVRRGRARAQPMHVIPRRHRHRAAPAQTLLRAQHGNAREHPIAGAHPLHLHVRHLLRHTMEMIQIRVIDADLRAHQIPQNRRLARPRLERAHGHLTRIQQNLRRLHSRHPAHRQEHPPLVRHLHHQAQRQRRRPRRPQPHHHITRPPDGVAIRVTHEHAGQPARVHTADACHEISLTADPAPTPPNRPGARPVAGAATRTIAGPATRPATRTGTFIRFRTLEHMNT